jgi:hypothetical protein
MCALAASTRSGLPLSFQAAKLRGGSTWDLRLCSLDW